MLVITEPPMLVEMPSATMAGHVAGWILPHPQINAVAVLRGFPRTTKAQTRPRAVGGEHLSISVGFHILFAGEILLVRNPHRIFADADRIVDRLFLG
jgi:hypothetical protein